MPDGVTPCEEGRLCIVKREVNGLGRPGAIDLVTAPHLGFGSGAKAAAPNAGTDMRNRCEGEGGALTDLEEWGGELVSVVECSVPAALRCARGGLGKLSIYHCSL